MGPVLGDPSHSPLTADVGCDSGAMNSWGWEDDGERLLLFVICLATGGRDLSTQDDYISSHSTPRSHKQATPSTTHTRTGPVDPRCMAA